MPTIGNTTASESPVPSESYVSGETTIRLEDHVADADAHAGIISTHESDTSTHGVTTIVGEDETQTLSNKTLVSPTITGTLTAAAISASGNITVGGTLGATSGTFSSTLAVTGDLAVNTNKFNVTAASGNTAVAGTLGVTGNFAVNTNKFTVAAASGNTVVAGTLGVTGNMTVDTNVLYVDTSANKVGINTTPSYPLHVAVNADSNEVLARFENSSAGSSAQVRATFTRGADAGTGTARGGVLFVSGTNFGIADYEARAMRFYTGASAGSNTERLTILAGGNVGINQSTPTYALDVTGTTRITGAATLGSTLGVTGATTLAGLSATTGTFSSTLAATGNFSVNTNKFSVTAASGNTTVAGTLGVTGTTTTSGELVSAKGIYVKVFTGLNDDTADSHSISLLNANCMLVVNVRGASVFLGGIFMIKGYSTIQNLVQASTTSDTLAGYTTSLGGTTGADNYFNIGITTSAIYVENRTGHDDLKVTLSIIGSVA